MSWKVSGNSSLPIAPLEQEWDGQRAREHIFRWAGWDKPNPSKRARKAFLLVNAEIEHEQDAYRLPFADVVNGELVAVPQAIDAIARALARNPAAFGLPPAVLDDLRRKVALYYRKMHAQPPDGLGFLDLPPYEAEFEEQP